MTSMFDPPPRAPVAGATDAIKMSQERNFESQLEAAGIWARATARRDNLAIPAEPGTKLPGIQSRLGAAGASLHLARRAGAAEGFALLVPRGRMLELTYLAVDPRAWGNGTGTHLLSYVSGYARSGGFEDLDLWVIDDNRRAIQVYERSGWRATADVKMSGDRLERRLNLPVHP